MAEIELSKVPSWPTQYVGKLASSWINTAEQVVAISATSGGIRSLAEQLTISEDEMRKLVSHARAALSPEVRAAMDQPFDSDERGMGALHPRKEAGGSKQEPA